METHTKIDCAATCSSTHSVSEYEEIPDEKIPLIKTNEKKLQSNNDSIVKIFVIRSIFLLLFTMAMDLGSAVSKQYMYKYWEDKAVIELNQTNPSSLSTHNHSTTDECGNGKNVSEAVQNWAQSQSATWNWYFRLIEHGGAIPFTFIFGYYSDYFGRKLVMQISILGNLLRYGVITVCIFYDLDLKYFFIGYGVDALAGCHYTFFGACMASVADKTDDAKTRLIGISAMEAVIGIGVSAASFGGGFFIQNYGFFYPALTATCAYAVVLVLVLLMETDTLREKPQQTLNIKETLHDMFALFHDKSCMKDGQLWKFNLSIIIFILIYFAHIGEISVNTFYELGSPFCWSPESLGYFSASEYLWKSLGGLGLIKLLQKCGVVDEVVALFGMMSDIGHYVIMGLSTQSWMLYAGIVRVH